MSTGYRIDWRPMARKDLRVIVRYISQDNPTRGKSFGTQLRGSVKPLSRYPELGRLVGDGVQGALRELVVHPHYTIFYQVLAASHTVQILRIKHVAQLTF